MLLRLHGYKWFSSATDSDMSLTLARLEGGSKLGMFYLKTRDEAGQLNNIQVRAVNGTEYQQSSLKQPTVMLSIATHNI